MSYTISGHGEAEVWRLIVYFLVPSVNESEIEDQIQMYMLKLLFHFLWTDH